MSAGLKGDLSTLRAFSARLRELPQVLANRVAAEAAPLLTEAALTTFNAGQDAYGIGWLPGVDGQRVTLRKTEALARGIRYVAIGTKLRVAIPVAYGKYQLGRRPVFPRQGQPLPASYVAALERAVSNVAREQMEAAR